MLTKTFAALGECMLEMHEQGNGLYQLDYAGDTYNTTVYLARYHAAHHVKIIYLTALGDDPYSQDMLKHWHAENIETEYVATIPNKLPGVYFVKTDSHGERAFYYYRQQSAARDMLNAQHFQQLTQFIPQIHYFYFSAISLAILSPEKRQKLLVLLEQLKAQGSEIIFDGNYRPRLWESPEAAKNSIDTVLPFVTLALPTFADEQLLYGDATPEATAQRLKQFQIATIVIKNGDAPCHLVTNTEHQLLPAAPVSRVIDTTGAGDSFNAGFLSAKFAGKTLSDCVHFAHQLAATVIGFPGAIISRDKLPAMR